MQTPRTTNQKASRHPFMRRLILSALAVFLIAPAALAQGGMQGPPAEAPEVEVSDQELDDIARAYIDVQQVLVEHRSALNQAEDAEEARAVQQEMTADANSVIQDHDVEIERFDTVIRAANADPELRNRLTSRLEELTQDQ